MQDNEKQEIGGSMPTNEDLCNLIQEQNAEIRMLREELKTKQSPWMTISEAAEYLRMSVSKIRKLVKDDAIPYKRLPGQKSTLLFTRRSLDLWIIDGKQTHSRKERERAEMWVN